MDLPALSATRTFSNRWNRAGGPLVDFVRSILVHRSLLCPGFRANSADKGHLGFGLVQGVHTETVRPAKSSSNFRPADQRPHAQQRPVEFRIRHGQVPVAEGNAAVEPERDRSKIGEIAHGPDVSAGE